MWYGFLKGSGGAVGGRGDIGALGMLAWGIGGGGTKAKGVDSDANGGEIRAVLMVI